MKKNVYMYQPNYLYGKDAYLPYAIGSIAAYAWYRGGGENPCECVQANYQLKELGYLRKPVSTAVKELEEPFLCAFSCYTWNYEYNKALASAIKRAYPECVIVFGGHQIARGYNEEAQEFVDIFIYDEGEIPFQQVLLALAGNGVLDDVPNIKYKGTDLQWHVTKQIVYAETQFPSPYLTGLFDSIVENTDFSFTPTLETNRGCPFSCGYCDWGIYKSKLRQFPMERVKAEIDWFSDHQIDLIFGADSNYGIFERDEDIIDYMVNKKKTTGYPRKFRVAYTKNTGERVFRINQKLNIEGMCKGATLSFQSLNEKTLEAVGRKNIPLNYFSSLMEEYNKDHIPTYSEIILGLPEETFDSFCLGVDRLLESGQHMSISMYLCELLPNSAMAQPEYMNKYQIQVADTVLNQYHCMPDEGDIVERSKVVIGTNVLSFEDWKKMYWYSLVVQSFHCLGLTRHIAIFLHYEYEVSYHDFYTELFAWCKNVPDTVAGKAFIRMNDIFEKFIEGRQSLTYHDLRFGNILWPLDEAWYLEIVYKAETFFNELESYLFAKYPMLAADKKGEDLLTYQRTITYTPYSRQKELTLGYNFPAYFSNIMSGTYQKLAKGNFRFKTLVDHMIDKWDDFAREIVWYGRKGGKNHLELERTE